MQTWLNLKLIKPNLKIINFIKPDYIIQTKRQLIWSLFINYILFNENACLTYYIDVIFIDVN